MPSLFERGRTYFSRAEAPVPTEPGLLDHASRHVSDAAAKAYSWIRTQSPWVAGRIDDAVQAASEMESRGFTQHFAEFNASLLRPLTDGTSEVVRAVRTTASCQPAEDPAAADTTLSRDVCLLRAKPSTSSACLLSRS